MTKVHYLDDFEGSGQEQQRQNLGKQVFKANAEISLFHRMRGHKIPGLFDIDFLQSVDNKTGKPILKVKDMRPASKDEQQEQQQK